MVGAKNLGPIFIIFLELSTISLSLVEKEKEKE
jgi:hypothetical protein